MFNKKGNQMKIAVPSRDNRVDNHFGHCQYYTIFTVDGNNKVVKKEILPSPQGCGCKSEIAGTLKTLGVEWMLAGNMGQGAVTKISGAGIRVVRGCSGIVDELVETWLAGLVADSGETCSHHHGDDEGHQCGNH